MIGLRHVLVATDFSPPSETALTYGRELARTFGARLHLLHVAENFFLRAVVGDPHAMKTASQRQVESRLSDDDRRSLHAVAALETSDSPAETIVEYATNNDIDLIVMGTHGRSAASQIFVGSVAERVVRTAHCPVLTVRNPEREFVVQSDVAINEVPYDRVETHPRRD